MEAKIFINYILNLNMATSRFLTNNQQDKAKNLIKEVKNHFEKNRKIFANDVILESLEILITNYGEIQYKFGLNTDIGRFITEYLYYYMGEKKKILGKH
jgi:hypothetical protein